MEAEGKYDLRLTTIHSSPDDDFNQYSVSMTTTAGGSKIVENLTRDEVGRRKDEKAISIIMSAIVNFLLGSIEKCKTTKIA